MDKTYAQIRKTIVTGKGHNRKRQTLCLKLHSLGQEPYFSATINSERCGPSIAGLKMAAGPYHKTIARLFPEFRPYLGWHLVTTAGPMRYLANAAYWAGLDKEWCRDGKGDPPNRRRFDSTTLWGALPGDTDLSHPMDDPALTRAALTAILEERLPVLLAAYRRDMETLFGSQAPEMLDGVRQAFATSVAA
jgi:hypothetical protein